jgi:hypothetical protein
MQRFTLALSLSYAFFWRFMCVASIEVVAFHNYMLYKVMHNMTMVHEINPEHLMGHIGPEVFILGFFSVFPFFVTMYWMIARGIFYRITVKYTQDYVPKRRLRALCYGVFSLAIAVYRMLLQAFSWLDSLWRKKPKP